MKVKRTALLTTTFLLALLLSHSLRLRPFSIPDAYAIIPGSKGGLASVSLALRKNSRLSARTAVVLAHVATIMVGPAEAFTGGILIEINLS